MANNNMLAPSGSAESYFGTYGAGSTQNQNPFDVFAAGQDYTPPVENVTPSYSQNADPWNFDRPATIDQNYFAQPSSSEQFMRPDARDGRPPLSERLKEKLGTVLNIGGRAVRSVMGLMESGTFGLKAASRSEQIGQMYEVSRNAPQAYNTVRNDMATAWDNRSQHANQAMNYMGTAGKETAMAGVMGAMQDLGERTGISYDRENGLSVKKAKLARFAVKAALAPHATAANTLRGAATAGLGAAKEEGWGQLQQARSSAQDAAMNYARNAF